MCVAVVENGQRESVGGGGGLQLRETNSRDEQEWDVLWRAEENKVMNGREKCAVGRAQY